MARTLLRETVRDYVDSVRASPAAGLGPKFDELARAAADDHTGLAATLGTPIAEYTWMSSLDLLASQETTELGVVDIPNPIEVVGIKPLVIFIDTAGTQVEPPISAIDLFLQLNRKDTLTARADKLQTLNDDTETCSLAAIDASIANRLIIKRMDANTTNVITWRLRWGVDATIRTALKYGNIRVRLNWYIRYLNNDRLR